MEETSMQRLIMTFMNAETDQKDPNFDLQQWIIHYNQEKNPENKLRLELFEDRNGSYLDVWAPMELIVRFSERNILNTKSLGVVLLDALKKIIEYAMYSNRSQFTNEEMDVIYEDLKKFTPHLGLDHESYYMEKLREIGRLI